MIPTPQRVATARRWGLLLACGLTAVGAATVAAVTRSLPAATVAAAVAGLIGAGIYRSFTRRWRRRGQVLRRGLPDHDHRTLRRLVPYYAALDADRQARFRDLAAVFLDETPIAGAGVEIDEEIRLLVAAGAVIPIMGFPEWEYATLRDVIVRPGRFHTDYRRLDGPPDALGMVGDRGGAFHGTVVFSERDLREGFARVDRTNVAIHEFAHLVDQADGAIDGLPAYLPPDRLADWMETVREEFAAGKAAWSEVCEYAFTDEREFFAVLSEYFFERPRQLRRRHPRLYALLAEAYRQDPAGDADAARG